MFSCSKHLNYFFFEGEKWIHKKKLVQLDAAKYCSQLGSTIILPKTASENSNMQNLMLQHKIESAWLGIIEKKHQPTWLAGEGY